MFAVQHRDFGRISLIPAAIRYTLNVDAYEVVADIMISFKRNIGNKAGRYYSKIASSCILFSVAVYFPDLLKMCYYR